MCPRSGFQQDMEGSLGISGSCQGEVGGTWGTLGMWEYLGISVDTRSQGDAGGTRVTLGWPWHMWVMLEDGEDGEGTRVAPRDVGGPGLIRSALTGATAAGDGDEDGDVVHGQ